MTTSHGILLTDRLAQVDDLPGAAPTVEEIDEQLSETHGAGSWEGGGGGGGDGVGLYQGTIRDGEGAPLDGVRVQLSTDADGLHVAYQTYTNASGFFRMRPDPGTYYRWLERGGFVDPDPGKEIEVE